MDDGILSPGIRAQTALKRKDAMTISPNALIVSFMIYTYS